MPAEDDDLKGLILVITGKHLAQITAPARQYDLVIHIQRIIKRIMIRYSTQVALSTGCNCSSLARRTCSASIRHTTRRNQPAKKTGCAPAALPRSRPGQSNSAPARETVIKLPR